MDLFVVPIVTLYSADPCRTEAVTNDVESAFDFSIRLSHNAVLI